MLMLNIVEQHPVIHSVEQPGWSPGDEVIWARTYGSVTH